MVVWGVGELRSWGGGCVGTEGALGGDIVLWVSNWGLCCVFELCGVVFLLGLSWVLLLVLFFFVVDFVGLYRCPLGPCGVFRGCHWGLGAFLGGSLGPWGVFRRCQLGLGAVLPGVLVGLGRFRGVSCWPSGGYPGGGAGLGAVTGCAVAVCEPKLRRLFLI